MNRFLLLSALIIVCGALPRTPRIYNVLISTKKNLSPSHALPVYEPVLRTTSLGLAFPSLYYNTPQVQVIQSANVQPLGIPGGIERSHQASGQEVSKPVRPTDQQLQANAERQFIGNEVKERIAPPAQQLSLDEYYENVNDPKNVIANLKRNPDIPDVKPPPLPLRQNNQ